MMGRRVAAEPRLSYAFRLEDHVPADHPLRRADALLDTGFVRRAMAPHYSATGRPSVCPELMVRMLLVGYLNGVRSERRLCAEVHLNLAYRWFCRLGLDGAVPDHSTFSRNRHGRFRASGVMRALFEEVVRLCAEAGPVPGEEVAADGSQVDADANRRRRLPGRAPPRAWTTAPDRAALARPVREYLDALDAAAAPTPDGPRRRPPKYPSPTDPAAAWSTRGGYGCYGYHANYLVDAAHGVIVDVEATPSRLSREIVAAKAMLERVAARLGRNPARFAADRGYGTAPFLARLAGRGVEAHVPVPERKGQTRGRLTRDAFRREPEADRFVCPEGKPLTYQGDDRANRLRTYRASPRDCGPCPARARCTAGRARKLVRAFDEWARDAARALADTPAFAAMRRKRRKVEVLFAHLKQQLGVRRLRLRGLAGAAEEFHLAAAAQNLRRLARLAARGVAHTAPVPATG